jgi:MYXO-CTERM domain-containing protein
MMKKISTLFVLPVIATGLALSQDQPATSTDANNPQTARAENTRPTGNNGHDYGWIGLIGLAGLLGLRRNRAYSDRTVGIDSNANYTGDVRRAG